MHEILNSPEVPPAANYGHVIEVAAGAVSALSSGLLQTPLRRQR